MAEVQHQHMTGWTGWIGFAGILLTVSGVIHALYGLGGIFGQDWYIYTANSAWLFDSSAWGWSMLAAGLLLIVASSLLLTGNMVGRVIGVLIAAGSLFVNAALFAAAPVWSGIAMFVDVMIIYAIIAHGSEMKEMKHLEDSRIS